ncbi:MAG: bifunctional phosphoribosylaminoimidazolecarboxamide formyltransferase/IMP cyclohydrolase [Hydrotalea sp.]|nr:bifunctional phosphoribosylaminoimidazolecarboxamide formyltransferase/IMP cyclohydrolase [Hydrotalea sp.]
MADSIAITRALISVSDKTGLASLAAALHHHGVAIVSSGGTADFLQRENIPTTRVEDATGFPEILGGRVKTLHPNIHGGILARGVDDDDGASDARDLAQHKIKKFDLVVVNLYPFADALAKKMPAQKMIEEIDIGGVALIRAGAKNFSSVVVVTNPRDYELLIAEMQKNNGQISLATRKKLASIAFRHVADYDALIADWFEGGDDKTAQQKSAQHQLPNHAIALRYGENPHQAATFLTDKKFGLGAMMQWQGKDLSYNNYLDLDAALRILTSMAPLHQPAAVIIKHTDPCGVAVAGDVAVAFKKAFSADPISAFGGIIGVNRAVDDNLAQAIIDLKVFFEIIIAPSFSDGAKKILAARRDLRLLSPDVWPSTAPREKLYRSVMGGILIQDSDDKIIDRQQCTVAAGPAPSLQQWQDLMVAMMVAKEMRSNAIAIVAGGVTLGLGGGATSRVMASEKAVHDLLQKKISADKMSSPVVASDGFLPFTDNVEIFIKGGIKAIIEPGGSVRDKDVIALCQQHNITLVFSHDRHFHH